MPSLRWIFMVAVCFACAQAGAEVAQDPLEPGQGAAAVDGASQPAPVATEDATPAAANDCGTIKPEAGDGTAAYAGDRGLAGTAELNGPAAVCVDAQGDLYIADRGNDVVREVDPSGIITTVAGNGQAGFSGDGGPAVYAQLNAPSGVCVDAAGNLYISDTLNHRIRRVDAGGQISTLAGDGLQGYNGDGAPALSAALDAPQGLCLDAAGNLYFSDEGNHVVRKVDAAGVVSTVAGDGTSGYSGDQGPATAAELAVPLGLAVDGSGNLYIVDDGSHVVRKVDADGAISTVVGDGTAGDGGDQGAAVRAELERPYGVAVDPAGNLYIADAGNHVVRKVDAEGAITTVAGNGTEGAEGDYGRAMDAELKQPEGLALDKAGNLYIADTLANQVRRVTCPQ